MESAIDFLFYLAILIFSVVLHEVSHGYVALALGDRTAKLSGRLTLNPVSHIDFFGSILVPILTGGRFGWAKPVPYNPYALRNQRWGPALVGIAGPAANILLAVVFGLCVRFIPIFLKIGLPAFFVFNFHEIATAITTINLVLAVFNFLPVPPLDGSKLLFAILPYRWRSVEWFLERYGFFIIIALLFFFRSWFLPLITFPVSLLFYLITGSLLF